MECVVRERFMGNQSQPAGEGAVYAPNSQGDAEERVWGFLWVRQADKVANFKGKVEETWCASAAGAKGSKQPAYWIAQPSTRR